MIKKTLVATALLGVVSTSAMAAGPVSSLRFAYANDSIDSSDNSGNALTGKPDGYVIAATLAQPNGFFMPIEYKVTSGNLDASSSGLGAGTLKADEEDFRIGAGLSQPISPMASLNFGARYLSDKTKYSGSGGKDDGTDKGFGGFIGADVDLASNINAYTEYMYAETTGSGINDGYDGHRNEIKVGLSADLGGPAVFAEYRHRQADTSNNGDDVTTTYDTVYVGGEYRF